MKGEWLREERIAADGGAGDARRWFKGQGIGTVRWPGEGPTGSDELFNPWVVKTLEVLPRRADGLLGVEGEATLSLVLPF